MLVLLLCAPLLFVLLLLALFSKLLETYRPLTEIRYENGQYCGYI